MKFRFRRAVVVVLCLIGAVALRGLLEARSDPVVRRVQVIMTGADPHAPPLRVALVSDIHVGNLAMPVWRLNRVVDQINAQHPDVILLAGDYVNGNGARSWDFYPWQMVAPLSRLHAPLGVHAVLGNHDIGSAQRYVDAALWMARIDVLHNRAIRIGPIALMGMDMEDDTRAAVTPVLAQARAIGGFPVLITHAPPFPGQTRTDIPLILAGHTHCGQVVLPGWDNSFDVPNAIWRFPPSLRCGIGHLGGQVVVTTGGVGAATIPPIRINAPPDFWILTLTGKAR